MKYLLIALLFVLSACNTTYRTGQLYTSEQYQMFSTYSWSERDGIGSSFRFGNSTFSWSEGEGLGSSTTFNY